jgi:DNA-binding transcriptional ArsR family regulator
METLIDSSKLKNVISTVKCLVSENRLLLIQLLLANGEMNVTEITRLLKLGQPLVSRHLQLLYNAGYLKRRRSGKHIYYSVLVPRVEMILNVSARLG